MGAEAGKQNKLNASNGSPGQIPEAVLKKIQEHVFSCPFSALNLYYTQIPFVLGTETPDHENIQPIDPYKPPEQGTNTANLRYNEKN